MLKRPKLPDGFQGKVFNARVRERVEGCVISSWTFLLLVGSVVTGSQHCQPSGSIQPVCGLRACGQHIVNFFHLLGVLGSAK